MDSSPYSAMVAVLDLLLHVCYAMTYLHEQVGGHGHSPGMGTTSHVPRDGRGMVQ